MRTRFIAAMSAGALMLVSTQAFAGMDEAKKWIDKEFQPSTLTKTEQLKELSNKIWAEIKERRLETAWEVTGKISVGDRVSFNNKKYGHIEGTVAKKNPTRVKLIDCSDGRRWTVPYGNLNV